MAEAQFFLNDREKRRKDSSAAEIQVPEAPEYNKKKDSHGELSIDAGDRGFTHLIETASEHQEAWVRRCGLVLLRPKRH
jgi:hypothetical protein